jgi:hypothetical protein
MNNTKKSNRYKLLTGNGIHTAVGEFIGVLLPPKENTPKRELLLTNGVVVEARFFGWHNKPTFINKCLGRHLFRGYPIVCDNKLIAINITAVDPVERIFDKVGQKNCLELWLFRGLWTPQRSLNVQRSLGNKKVKVEAKKTGFIKKYKYQFKNSKDWKTRLWDNYVYEVYAYRDKDNQFNILKVNPFCCPLHKPVKK